MDDMQTTGQGGGSPESAAGVAEPQAQQAADQQGQVGQQQEGGFANPADNGQQLGKRGPDAAFARIRRENQELHSRIAELESHYQQQQSKNQPKPPAFLDDPEAWFEAKMSERERGLEQRIGSKMSVSTASREAMQWLRAQPGITEDNYQEVLDSFPIQDQKRLGEALNILPELAQILVKSAYANYTNGRKPVDQKAKAQAAGVKSGSQGSAPGSPEAEIKRLIADGFEKNHDRIMALQMELMKGQMAG